MSSMKKRAGNEIKIRNLDPRILGVIERKAKQRKMSREEYLRTILTAHAGLKEFETMEARYQTLGNKTIFLLSDILEKLKEIKVLLTDETEGDEDEPI